MNLREMQKVQQKLIKLQDELAKTLFTGTAGGGAVSITLNGKFEMVAVKIDPEAFNAEDIVELEVMILAAAKDAQSRVNETQEKMTMNMTGGMKIPGLF